MNLLHVEADSHVYCGRSIRVVLCQEISFFPSLPLTTHPLAPTPTPLTFHPAKCCFRTAVSSDSELDIDRLRCAEGTTQRVRKNFVSVR